MDIAPPSRAATKELTKQEKCIELLSLNKWHRKYEENMTDYNTFCGSLIIAMNIHNSDSESKIIQLNDLPDRDIGRRRKQCREIIKRLGLMGCPYEMTIRSFLELDYGELLPIVEWVTRQTIMKISPSYPFRKSFIEHFDKKFDTEPAAVESYENEVDNITDYAMSSSCTHRTFLSQIYLKQMGAVDVMAKYAWILKLHQENHSKTEDCEGINPPAAASRQSPRDLITEDKDKDLIRYRDFLLHVTSKICIDEDIHYVAEKMENQIRKYQVTKNEMEYLQKDIDELEKQPITIKKSDVNTILEELNDQLTNVKAYKKKVRKHKEILDKICDAFEAEYINNKADVKNDKLDMFLKLDGYTKDFSEIIMSCKALAHCIRKASGKLNASKCGAEFTEYEGSHDLKARTVDNSHMNIILSLCNHITEIMEAHQNVPGVDSDKAVIYYDAYFAYIDDLSVMLYDAYWMSTIMMVKREELEEKFEKLRKQMRMNQIKRLQYDQTLNRLAQANSMIQQSIHLLKMENMRVMEIRNDLMDTLPKVDTRNVIKNTLLKQLQACELL